MAWLLLPENVQVQYLQKIAQMRRKYLRPQIFNDAVEANFLHEVQFSAAIEAAHFLGRRDRALARRLLPFSQNNEYQSKVIHRSTNKYNNI